MPAPPTPIVDLRSDTVTKPTAEMREAMAQAEVGDDCYRDDPSVARLEEEVARRVGQPAALFVPSGTMANQLAVAAHTRPGEFVATPPMAHVQVHEDAAAARLSGVQLMPLGAPTGYAADELEALMDEEISSGWPRVGLAWLENTLGMAGGVVWPVAGVRAVANSAHARGRHVHLDGARLWNAAVAQGCEPSAWGALVDSVSVCLSKGLGCPVGSVLAGSPEFIDRATALRHGFGGSLRQAGVLAAAGSYALEHHVERLADDHRRARRLGEELGELPVWDAVPVHTNIVLLDTSGPAEELCARLREAGVVCYPNRHRQVRLVTHLGIDDADVERVIATARTIFG